MQPGALLLLLLLLAPEIYAKRPPKQGVRESALSYWK